MNFIEWIKGFFKRLNEKADPEVAAIIEQTKPDPKVMEEVIKEVAKPTPRPEILDKIEKRGRPRKSKRDIQDAINAKAGVTVRESGGIKITTTNQPNMKINPADQETNRLGGK